MNQKNLNQALLISTFNVLTDLSLNKKKKMARKTKGNGYMYTYYSKNNNSISIGFAQHMSIVKNKFTKKDYTLIKLRKGTINEERCLKETLQELGYKSIKDTGDYLFSEKLKLDLQYLGWQLNIDL